DSTGSRCQSTCVPKSCADLGNACGALSDGCGQPLNCSCASGQRCVSGSCCTPTQTCASGNHECGPIDDGCGDWPSCGDCAPGLTCVSASGGNRCEHPCQPKTCDELGDQCGSVSDGCGHPLDCTACYSCHLTAGACASAITTCLPAGSACPTD